MLAFLRQYFPYFRDYRKQFLFGFLAMAVAAGSTAAVAYLVRPVLDDIFIAKNAAMLAVLPLLVIAAYAGKGLGTFAQVYFISYVGNDIIRRLKDHFLAHLLRLDMAFFNRNRGGELISRMVHDTNKVQQAVSVHIANFLREALTAAGLIAVVIYQSPKLAVIGLVVLPLAFWPLSLLARRMKRISKRVQEKMSDIIASLGEIFNSVEIVKANNTEALEQERVAAHNRAFFRSEMKRVKTAQSVNPMMELLGAFAGAGVIVVGGQSVISGELTVGAFFSFMTALFMLYTPIRQMSAIHNKFYEAIAANERINGYMALQPEVVDGSAELAEPIRSLAYEDVSLRYTEEWALHGVSTTLRERETVALVGPSGSGKSSFVNLLLRFFDPQEGRVLVNGRDLREFRVHSLRARLAIVTQRVYIFGDTIAANVAYGQPLDPDRVERALRHAHAWEFVERLPAGTDTLLDESGTNLSGGQRQRIAIARALYTDPEVLVMDEATSALDNESERAITRALEEIRHDRILILIAHRPATLRLADRILVFEDGHLVGDGPEDELLATCAPFQRLQEHPAILQ